ncbi:hypothetical protein [Qipengyuania sp. MTN3-11]|uniref:hypothetical protein n=1 Tax=Qipengyuania sp. MTN3-11 TaxID=3056557 RepID=UPI0036F3C77E
MSQAIVTALMAVAFCAVHIFVGRLEFLDREPRSRWLSFAGGVAVGYVFLHILPELGSHATTFEQALGLPPTLSESWVHALALAGLVLFYGIERALTHSRGRRRAEEGRDRPHRGIFRLHIAASALLIFVIAYLLNHREDTTAAGLILFFAAMILHFVTADYGTRHDHPEMYDERGRWVLVAATLVGWAVGTQLVLPQIVVGFLFAFVGGCIVLVVLKEELPEERKSYFLPFLGGAVIYSMLAIGEQYLAA